MSIIRNRTRHMLPVLLAAGLVLAACGSDEGEPEAARDQGGAQPAATMEVTAGDPTATEAAAEPEPTSDPGDVPAPAALNETATAEPSPTPEPVDEPEDPAPELGSIDSWHNSSPVTLAELRGTPVLLVFWADY